MKNATTITIRKTTRDRFKELLSLNETSFVDWDTAITDLIDYVLEKEDLKLSTINE